MWMMANSDLRNSFRVESLPSESVRIVARISPRSAVLCFEKEYGTSLEMNGTQGVIVVELLGMLVFGTFTSATWSCYKDFSCLRDERQLLIGFDLGDLGRELDLC
jgi:hypothetical protein